MVILVDLINTLYIKDQGLDQELFKILSGYSNKKIIVTNAEHSKIEKLDLSKTKDLYEIFTLQSRPRKENKDYFDQLINKFNLNINEVLLIDHNPEVVKLAKSYGIKALLFDKDNKNYNLVSKFLAENL